MKIIASILAIVPFILFGCDRPNPKVQNAKSQRLPDSVRKSSKDSATGAKSKEAEIRASAHLIYADGTLSSFDVLNDKTIPLWNVVAGEGAAAKPSEETKINFQTNIDDVHIKILNGRKLIIDTNITHSRNDLEFTIKNTGCSEVYIKVFKSKALVYNDTIPFHCGE